MINMKKKALLFIFLLQISLFVFAGGVVKKSGEIITGVTNIVVDGDIVKFTLDGKEQTMPLSEVHAILYDNGKYEEIKSTNSNQPINETVADESEFEIENIGATNSNKNVNSNKNGNSYIETVLLGLMPKFEKRKSNPKRRKSNPKRRREKTVAPSMTTIPTSSGVMSSDNNW